MRRAALTLGLVLFVAADIGLIVLAVRHVQADPPVTSTGAAAGVQDPSPPDDPSDKRTGEDGPEPSPGVTSVLLSVADDGTILTAVPGNCETDNAAQVTLSTDGGETFQELTPDLTEVVRLSTPSAGLLSVIGADADCEVQTYTSTDRGASWQTSGARDQWYPDPADRQVVHSPQGDVEPGCGVRFVHPIDDAVARVTCRDGDLFGTADVGQEWIVLGSLPGARAVVYQSPGNGFALAEAEGCAAQAYTTIDGGDDWEPAGCMSAEGIQGLAFNGATMVAQVGDEIFQSTDNAQTWSQP